MPRTKQPRAPGAECGCGRPAGPNPVRCVDCGALICEVCGPPDLCLSCAIRELALDDAPVDPERMAEVLGQVEAEQRRLMERRGLVEAPLPAA